MRNSETSGNNSSPDMYRYIAAVSRIRNARHVTPQDVRALLDIRQTILSVIPEDLSIALDRWEIGNRIPALEYILCEAFEVTPDKLTDYDSYKQQAGLWLKCAEALLTEPICKTPEMYASSLIRADRWMKRDPELYTVIAAAVSWNAARTSRASDVFDVTRLYREYVAARTNLFGPDIKPSDTR